MDIITIYREMVAYGYKPGSNTYRKALVAFQDAMQQAEDDAYGVWK